MINIEVALNQIFTYKRNEHPLLKELVNDKGSCKSIHMDRRFENNQIGIYGVCPVIFDGRSGIELYFYTAEQNFEREGEPLADRFRGLNNCPYVHFGVLLNCLAYLTGSRLAKLVLCRVANGCELISMKVRRDLAEIFLSNISNKPLQEFPHINKQNQFAMFKN